MAHDPIVRIYNKHSRAIGNVLATFILYFLFLYLLHNDLTTRWQEIYDNMTYELLYIKKVQINGTEHLQAKDLLEQAALTMPMYVFDINVHKIKYQLELNSRVKSASVKLIMPSLIKIDVAERIPAALWMKNNKFYLIDSSGAILEEINDPAAYKHYIIITGEEANTNLNSILIELKKHGFSNNIQSLQLVGVRRWNLLLQSGAIVKLPERNLSLALQILKKLLVIYADNQPDMIDLRIIPDKIYIKF